MRCLGVAAILEALADPFLVVLVLIIVALSSGVLLPPARPHYSHQVPAGLYYKTQYNSNNSIEFFIICVPSQQLQGQLQTQHSVDTGNYIKDKHNIRTIIIIIII
jgi:hypothetical protein